VPTPWLGVTVDVGPVGAVAVGPPEAPDESASGEPAGPDDVGATNRFWGRSESTPMAA
jgi:hypothetical protein